MLPADEIKRRIHAARILRDVTQAELQTTLAEAGLGRREFGRVERGQLRFSPVHRVVIARALRVPEWWFTEESVDAIVGLSPPAATSAPPAPEDELLRRISDGQTTDENRRAPATLEEQDDRQGTGG